MCVCARCERVDLHKPGGAVDAAMVSFRGNYDETGYGCPAREMHVDETCDGKSN